MTTLELPLRLIDGALIRYKEKGGIQDTTIYSTVISEDESDFLSYPRSTSVCIKDQNNTISYADIDDLELVTEEVAQLEENKAPDFSLEEGRTLEDVYKDIENLFAQMYQYYEAQDIGKCIELRITAEGYAGDKKLEIKQTCRVGYDNDVTTNELDKSVKIATSRYKENENNKPKELSLK